MINKELAALQKVQAFRVYWDLSNKTLYFICTFWRLIKANLVLCTSLAFHYLKSNMSTHSIVIFIGTVPSEYNIITGLGRD